MGMNWSFLWLIFKGNCVKGFRHKFVLNLPENYLSWMSDFLGRRFSLNLSILKFDCKWNLIEIGIWNLHFDWICLTNDGEGRKKIIDEWYRDVTRKSGARGEIKILRPRIASARGEIQNWRPFIWDFCKKIRCARGECPMSPPLLRHWNDMRSLYTCCIWKSNNDQIQMDMAKICKDSMIISL
jgi:hypothetical protein